MLLISAIKEEKCLKKLMLLLLLATFCLSIVGCSSDKAEGANDDTYRETITLKDGNIIGGGPVYKLDWKHTTNKFTNEITSLLLNSSKNVFDDKAKTSIAVKIKSINKGDKDVYNSLKKLEIIDDKGHRAKLIRPKADDVVPAGKKYEELFEFEFNDVEDYKTIKSVTLKYPMYFGADDDAHQEKKYNEITFEIE